MTLAPPARVFSFEDFARANHRHFPGDRLDAQFAAHQDAISGIQAFLAKAFRSDGQILNGAITPETLSPDLVAEITRKLRQEFKSDLEKAHRAAEQARFDAQSAKNDLLELRQLTQRAIDAAQNVNGSAGSVLYDLARVRERTEVALAVQDARQADLGKLQATIKAGEGESEAWAVASMHWAEHMGGTLPAETIAWMGLTGDHWSSRWWANYADQVVSAIQDEIDGVLAAIDDFEDYYLGSKPSDPLTDNDGDPLQVGAIYFNTTDGTMHVWNGTVWQSAPPGASGPVGPAGPPGPLGPPGPPTYATIADTPPSSPAIGQFWWESDSGTLFLRYDDGSSVQWVDISGSTALANYLPLSGGALTGFLTLHADPSLSAHAANKNYVDARIAAIPPPPTPPDLTPYATKTYVDTQNASQNTSQNAVNAAQDTVIASKLPLAGGTLTGPLVTAPSTGAISQVTSGAGLEVKGAAGAHAAYLAFHRPGQYAILFGLDTDNQMAYGGWSMGAARRVLWDSNNFNPAAYAPVGGVSGNFVIGSATHYTDGNIYMPWAADTLANVFGRYLPLGGGTLSGQLNANGPFVCNGRPYVPGAPVTAQAANGHISNPDNNGIYRNNSSLRYKTEIETLEPAYGDKILDLRPVFYRSNELTMDDPSWSWFGFIAEETDLVDFRFTGYSTDQNDALIPDHVHVQGMLAALVEFTQRLHARVEALEAP